MPGVWSLFNQVGSEVIHHGRVVRLIWKSRKPRIFTLTPSYTRIWQNAYDVRSSVEWVFSRMADGYPLDHHFIRGLTQTKARIGLSMVIVLSMAIVCLCSNQPDLFRSLVEPMPVFNTS